MSALAPSLEVACRRWSERPAITFEGRTISYSELGAQIASLASAYQRLGIGAGDRVLCQLRDCPEHVVAMGAAWARGAVHAGTDNDLTGRELAELVRRTDAAALVFQPRADRPDPMEPARAVRRASPATTLIVHGGPPGMGAELGHDLGSLLDPPRPSASSDAPALGPADTAVLLLTSGTTGRAKMVKESLANCWAKMHFFADAFCPGPDDVHLVYLPMGHVFGMRLALIALLTGGRLVLLDRFSPEEALGLVGAEGVTVLPGMPAHFRLLLDRLDPDRHRVTTLRSAVSAAASLPQPLVEQLYRRLEVEILYVYGCSEGFTTLTTDRDEILGGSVGRRVYVGPEGTAPAGTVRAVAPADHTPLPPGQVGELAFGARQPVHYWDDPPVATDGWYYTGDLGRVDPDGSVFVLGRLKELVNRGGLKVSPSEIELAIAAHPEVADAAVIGAPDPVLEEAICACIVPASEHPPGLAEVRALLAENLARHKLPDELCIVDRIPRTTIGKVDRPALQETVVGGGLTRERHRPR